MQEDSSTQRLQRTALEQDETGLLSLFRDMKKRLLNRNALPGGQTVYDRAVVVTHAPSNDRLQIGIVTLTPGSKAHVVIFPMNEGLERAKLGEEQAFEGWMENDKEFTERLTKEFEDARAQLDRSKQTRASLYATIQHADEVSKRTRALLNNDK